MVGKGQPVSSGGTFKVWGFVLTSPWNEALPYRPTEAFQVWAFKTRLVVEACSLSLKPSGNQNRDRIFLLWHLVHSQSQINTRVRMSRCRGAHFLPLGAQNSLGYSPHSSVACSVVQGIADWYKCHVNVNGDPNVNLYELVLSSSHMSLVQHDTLRAKLDRAFQVSRYSSSKHINHIYIIILYIYIYILYYIILYYIILNYIYIWI